MHDFISSEANFRLILSFSNVFNENKLLFSKGQSYNQPIFPPNSIWNQYATTSANQSQIGSNPIGLYIDMNNSIYTINRQNGRILIWMNNSTDPNLILYTNLSSYAYSIFVTTNEQIYVGDSTSIKQIIQFSNSYSNQTTTIATVSSNIYGLFVDLNNTLYWSMFSGHKVVKNR